MKAAAGMVSTHATTMLPATPQRTADIRLIAPTPMIAPLIVWVVLTGTPRKEAIRIEAAPPVSAAKPPIGRSWRKRTPSPPWLGLPKMQF